MGESRMSKVMKYQLIYMDGCGDFHEMQEAVWDVTKKVRQILNKTIQRRYQWDCKSREHFELTGEYLDAKKELGESLDNNIYHAMRSEYGDISSAIVNATVQKASKRYSNSQKNVLKGDESLPSFKKDQPILLHKKNNIKLMNAENDIEVILTLFSADFKKATGKDNRVRFKVLVKDGTQKSIISKLLSGEYALGQSQLVYDKKKWFLLLTYEFAHEKLNLDPEKILGVDLGEAFAIYASSLGQYERLPIEGGEVTAYAKKLEERKKSLQHQAAYCGDGRIGHGTKTRVDAVYKTEDRIANFRKTINHRYSKALIEFALQYGYGTIQMEDLRGIKADMEEPRRLRHWTYYDLQSKIEAKAAEHGIVIRKVNPQFTSQRCSRCGCISADNRKKQATFCCVSCGYKANADYNASQNLSIKDIDKIIAKELGAKGKQPEKA